MEKTQFGFTNNKLKSQMIIEQNTLIFKEKMLTLINIFP